jgi:hypothetical protein
MRRGAARRGASRSAGEGVAMSLHREQDLQSLLMHEEAVRLLREDPSLVERLQQTLSRWSMRDDTNSRPLLQRWIDIVAARDWATATADTEEGRQLRQASPMATLLPEETRLAIIREVQSSRKFRFDAAGG